VQDEEFVCFCRSRFLIAEDFLPGRSLHQLSLPGDIECSWHDNFMSNFFEFFRRERNFVWIRFFQLETVGKLRENLSGSNSLGLVDGDFVDCLVSALYSRVSGRAIIWEAMQ